MTPSKPASTNAEKPKLSALIRRGAEMVEGQFFGIGYGQLSNPDNKLRVCAMGAAYVAVFGNVPVLGSPQMEREVIRLTGVTEDVVTDVISMNDGSHMTFNQIIAALEARGL